MTRGNILDHIRAQGFAPLGWLAPAPGDELPDDARCVLLIGNAGPDMFQRFARERSRGQSLDEWTRQVAGGLAVELGARAVFPFDLPPPPFLRWGRRAGAGHVSPLGLNIHPLYGLWHAYRAALLFAELPPWQASAPSNHPCESCVSKPCLHACPVAAFNGSAYDVQRCVQWLEAVAGEPCMTGGCQARLACPVGREFAYAPAQMQFHMQAFRHALRR